PTSCSGERLRSEPRHRSPHMMVDQASAARRDKAIVSMQRRLQASSARYVAFATGIVMLTPIVVMLAVILGMHAAAATPPGPTDSPRLGALVHLQGGALALLPNARADAASPPPLLVLLHGAGQNPMQMIERFSNDPDASGAV